MPGHLTLLTPPATEVLSVAQAKTHLRVEQDMYDDDELISSLVTAARQWVEEITGRSLLTQTWKLALAGFPGATGVLGVPVYGVDPLTLPGTPVSGSVAFRYALRLPRGIVQSITSVQYRDATGALQTLDSLMYVLSADQWEATLTPAPGAIWPTTLVHPEGAVITYVAGYGTAPVTIPQAMLAAIKLLVGTWYETREAVTLARFTADEVPFTVTALLAPYRIMEFV